MWCLPGWCLAGDCKYFSVWTVVNVHCFNDDVSGLMVFNIPAHSAGHRGLIMQISDLKDTRDKNMSTHSHPATRHQGTKRGIYQPNYLQNNHTKTHCAAWTFKWLRWIKYFRFPTNCINNLTIDGIKSNHFHNCIGNINLEKKQYLWYSILLLQKKFHIYIKIQILQRYCERSTLNRHRLSLGSLPLL